MEYKGLSNNSPSPPRSPPSSKSPLSSWESSIINELETRDRHNHNDLDTEMVNVGQKLWLDFQNTATSIAQVCLIGA